jgi:hypothetical protein
MGRGRPWPDHRYVVGQVRMMPPDGSMGILPLLRAAVLGMQD